MNRNTELHFAENPTNIDMQRSKFVREMTHKTTFNAGDLIPIYVDDALPGDTIQMDMASCIRMSTPIYPVMDNAYIDTYFFSVPERLVWQHWKEFMGENTTSKWEQEIEYQMPQIKAPSGGWAKGTIADYMGVPTKIDNLSIRADYFRAYALIWNEWFRDQNLKDPAHINMDDATVTGSNGSTYQTDAQLGGMPLKAAKFADYFTTALPEPQKGPDVMLPIGGNAPVVTGTKNVTMTGNDLHWLNPNGNIPGLDDGNYHTLVTSKRSSGEYNTQALSNGVSGGTTTNLAPANLWADLGLVNAVTVNQLRQAFAVQRWYEKAARGGTRYTETILAHFGVTSPDSRMQRPEYLGGKRWRINMDQVLQTSSTNTTSPQGNTAAYSLTCDNSSLFTHSCTEHCIIMGLMVVRTDHTYQQGLAKKFSRKSIFDFYWPSFANLGEQAILNKEIYAQGTAADDEVFGYQEAWADYRYSPSRVSGAFRSNYAQPLDAWHYADYYTKQPILSSDWIDETRANINRTIAVQDELEDQFIGDILFKAEWTRPMPIYSIPGLIDHH